MANRLCVLLVVLALMSGTAAAQDARTVLQAADRAMGASNLKSIQYSGTGWHGAVGQSFSPDLDWPRSDLKSYTRTIDYDARSSKEEFVRVLGNNPPRGGGFLPIQGERRQVQMVSGNYAWTMQGNNANPQPAAAELRQLEIWLTPHGFIKVAMAANPMAVSRTEREKRVTVVSFTALGKYRVNGAVNDQNLVERVQTWVPNPVLGDMVLETRYTDYKDFGGVKFPTLIHAHQGDTHQRHAGHNSLEITVSNVQANVRGAALTVPDAVRQATVPQVPVESQKLADGVWFLAGGSHNSLAVEFRDFVAVVEAPRDEERSLAVIEEVMKLIPNKRIRYLVNTHHHFDHSGGIRTYVEEGATIITHEGNRDFYDQVVFSQAPRTLMPDRLSLAPRLPPFQTTIETLTEQYALSDGARTMEFHHVRGLNHNANMLIAYLPKEKIMVNADLYSPRGPGNPAAPNASSVTLYENIKRLKLDIATIAPIHGRVVPMSDFVEFMRKAE